MKIKAWGAYWLLLSSTLAQDVEWPTTISGPLGFDCSQSPVPGNKIENLRIQGIGSAVAVTIKNCSGILVRNLLLGPEGDVGVHIENSSNIEIRNSRFDRLEIGVYALQSSGIFVHDNQFSNAYKAPSSQEPDPISMFIQFDKVTGGECIRNVGENFPGASWPRDLINLYNSKGTQQAPLVVRDNWLRGGGPTVYGGGIILGDGSGSVTSEFQTATRNILVDPGQYGMQIHSGTHHIISGNLIFGRSQPFTNIGIWAQCNINPSYNVVTENRIHFRNSAGQLNATSSPSCPGVVDGNSQDLLLDASILPRRLLTPTLVAHYEFDGTTDDATGYAPNHAIASGTEFRPEEGKSGSIFLNGSGSMLSVAGNAILRPSGDRITVSAWLRPTGTSGGAILRSPMGDGWNSGWRMVQSGSSISQTIVTDEGGQATLVCPGLRLTAWNFVAFVYDGAEFRCSVNGERRAATPHWGKISYNPDPAFSELRIGKFDGAQDFRGFIDEVKVYRGDLLDEEIKFYYERDVALFDGLSARYGFESDFLDSGPNGLHGTGSGAVFVPNGNGNSLSLSGSGPHGSVPDHAALRPTSRLTVMAWINPTTTSGVRGFLKAPNSDGWNSGWRLAVENGSFVPRVITSSGAKSLYSGSVPTGKWSHVALTYDGTSLKSYVNGNLRTSSTKPGSIQYGPPGDLLIGVSSGTQFFGGGIDEFAIFDNTLESYDIARYYERDRTKFEGVVAKFDFQDHLYDAGGYQLHAVNHGIRFSGAGNNRYAIFDGDAYLEVPDSQVLRPGNEITLSMWIKPEESSGIRGLVKSAHASGWDDGWRIVLENGRITARVVTNSGATGVQTGTIPPGVWSHLVLTYDGASVKIYLNGSLENSKSRTGNILYLGNPGNDAMRFGASNGVQNFLGSIDACRVLRRSLSSEEIQSLYFSQAAIFEE